MHTSLLSCLSSLTFRGGNDLSTTQEVVLKQAVAWGRSGECSGETWFLYGFILSSYGKPQEHHRALTFIMGSSWRSRGGHGPTQRWQRKPLNRSTFLSIEVFLLESKKFSFLVTSHTEWNKTNKQTNKQQTRCVVEYKYQNHNVRREKRARKAKNHLLLMWLHVERKKKTGESAFPQITRDIMCITCYQVWKMKPHGTLNTPENSFKWIMFKNHVKIN